jgi:hypothetical protein
MRKKEEICEEMYEEIYNEYYFDYDGTLPPPRSEEIIKKKKLKKLTHLLDISKEIFAYCEKELKEAESFFSYIKKQPGKQNKIGNLSDRDNIPIPF